MITLQQKLDTKSKEIREIGDVDRRKVSLLTLNGNDRTASNPHQHSRSHSYNNKNRFCNHNRFFYRNDLFAGRNPSMNNPITENHIPEEDQYHHHRNCRYNKRYNRGSRCNHNHYGPSRKMYDDINDVDNYNNNVMMKFNESDLRRKDNRYEIYVNWNAIQV